MTKANPNYTFLKNNFATERMVLLQGGTRSGKTYAVIYFIIWLCKRYPDAGMEIDLVRDTFAALKSTAWKDFQKVLTQHGLYRERAHKKSDHIYVLYGNYINYYGADNPDKIHGRSRDILWINEAHQFPGETIDQLLPRTRYKIICDYNPNLPRIHWLDDYIERYPPLITTFRDNPHLTKDQVEDIKIKIKDKYWWKVYGLGERTLPEVKNPYLYNFEADKHVADLEYEKGRRLYFSFDFNVDPFACIIGHIYRDSEGHHIHVFDEITLHDGDVYKMADRIKSMFTLAQLAVALFTGDAMQRKREITQRNNIDAWTILKRELKISEKRLKVPRSNPRVSENRHLVNSILAIHPDIKIGNKCERLLLDCELVETDEEGNLLKKNRSKETQRADHLDAFRYMMNTFMFDFMERTAKYLQ